MHRTLALLALIVVAMPGRMVAQQACPMKGDTASAMAGMGGMGRMMDHAMMARMDTLDARLDSLSRAMSRTTGTRKMNAMSELLGALVAQHREMRRMMHEHMMAMMDMPGMSGEAGMMQRMNTSGCNPVAVPDSTKSRDPMHQH